MPTNYLYLGFMIAMLVAAGAAEYLHIAPGGTFYAAFLVALGLVAPSPAFPHANVAAIDTTTVAANTAATRENTAAMTTGTPAPQPPATGGIL